ncbi:alpha/beta fold hydrolase [Ilumatobacter nonamiensis]|uniref:alpha/beta fold hydrolase n=1 Tax=Ilumatobacter nonamiensis TaxID=467093 RepID=UPI0006887332|nr:alpha/beta hydrolase [Ilumatobacter nonamiensis]
MRRFSYGVGVNRAEGLRTREWGSGERIALLLHGQFGSGTMWWQVGPAIASHGYRVVALDLPGHGHSPPDSDSNLASCVEQIVAACPQAELAIGHSLGSLLLAHCVHEIGARRAIYIDSPFTYERSGTLSDSRRRASEMKARRTLEWLTETRPHWSDEDRRVEAVAAEQFDVETSLSLMTSLSGLDHRPRPGVQSLIVVPRPSDYFTPSDLELLRQDGFTVVEVDGAGHTVWYGRVDEFMAAISDWL